MAVPKQDGKSASYPLQEPPECQIEACDLQTCLNKNTLSPDKCGAHLFALYQCCQRMYEQKGDKAESTACPNPNAVERWIKDHSAKK